MQSIKLFPPSLVVHAFSAQVYIQYTAYFPAHKATTTICLLGLSRPFLHYFSMAHHSARTNGILCTGDPHYVPYTLLLIS